jgi:hypothetical protein
VPLPPAKHNATSFVDDGGTTVLKVVSNNSAGSFGIPLKASREANNTKLEWRRIVNRVLDKADMDHKTADDFTARVHVLFDVPLESLAFVERYKIRLPHAVANSDVPTAALCYVWDNKLRIGHCAWSPYTSRAQRVVLQSGNGNVNKWVSESRDVATDFKNAFGSDAPAVTGMAVGNDTDNTDEAVTTWFGDIKFVKLKE